MELRFPKEKLIDLQSLLQEWVGRKSCTKRDPQSLAGKFQQTCRVIQPGRTFIKRTFATALNIFGADRKPNGRAMSTNSTFLATSNLLCELE